MAISLDRVIYDGTRYAKGSQARPSQSTRVLLYKDDAGGNTEAALETISDLLDGTTHPEDASLLCTRPLVECLGQDDTNTWYRVTCLYEQDVTNVPYSNLPAPVAKVDVYTEQVDVPHLSSGTYTSSPEVARDAGTGAAIYFQATRIVRRVRCMSTASGAYDLSANDGAVGKTNSNSWYGIAGEDRVLYAGVSTSLYKITSSVTHQRKWHTFLIGEWVDGDLRREVSPWATFKVEEDDTLTVNTPETASLPEPV